MNVARLMRTWIGDGTHPAKRPRRKRALSTAERKLAAFSFSQFGEDLALVRYFEERTGFYVDVGAHHPIRFSNTHLLHRRGWSGINIDAHPGAIELFRKLRPNDLSIQAAISDKVEAVEFLLYDEPALSRIEVHSGAAAAGNSSMPQPARKLNLKTTTLAALLASHLPAGQKIDFLNVDCEGHDLAVLASNDWTRYAAELVCVEDWEPGSTTPIDKFLIERGYTLVYLARPAKLFARTSAT